jgi:CRISPR/Cas system type I-B associated protein Csh2 (Cas7 group RAMP superfamily)
MPVDIKQDIRDRMKDFEANLLLVAECRKKEMEKPFNRRNYEVLYMLHKDEALYRYCLNEFNNLLDRMV